MSASAGTSARDTAGGTFASRLVDRAATALRRAGISRRGFLYRLALVGSALAVNPLQYILRPTTAYASVCGDAASCGGGWSAFCCTINDGANTCPDGSYVAGWWKVGDSSFCLGEPRYYIDCNRLPGSSCRCRCADGPCDKRRVCCNVFRYGQCNTQIAGTTEVVCRIVTCTPPWEWDPACSTTVRTEEATRTHSATCLPGPNPTRIAIRYQDLGMTGSVLGAPVSDEGDAARGGRFRRYDNGWLFFLPALGAHYVYGRIAERYSALGREQSRLGYPTADHAEVGDGRGRLARFENGSIYATPSTGAHDVAGAIYRRYRQLGGPRGDLGYPTTGRLQAGAGGFVNRFEDGNIYFKGSTGAVAVLAPFLEPYMAAGGPSASGLGYPLGPAGEATGGGRYQIFEDGRMLSRSGIGTHLVRGAIAERFVGSGGAGGPWGYPMSDQRAVGDGRGEVATFEDVTVWSSPSTGPHALSGAVLDAYRDEGAAQGSLGYPTSDVFAPKGGGERASFEGGAIVVEPVTGQRRVLRRRSQRSAADLPSPSASGSRRETRDPSELP